MKPKKKQKKLRITEKDFILANRRAARIEEIEAHGRPISFRKAIHKSKKVYDRKALKRQASDDDLPYLLNINQTFRLIFNYLYDFVDNTYIVPRKMILVFSYKNHYL